jgi:hypothetical protein
MTPTKATEPLEPLEPPSFTWRVTEVQPERLAVAPTLRFALQIGCSGAQRVQCVVLSVSVRIAAALRHYDEATRDRLRAVFGTDEQWRDSLRDLVWARPTVIVPSFEEQTTVELPVPCGQDIDLATTSYLRALRDGEVPLRFFFNGTVFHESRGRLHTAQIPWEGEAAYRMPAETWHRLREAYFGRDHWLRIDSAVADRLHEYQTTGAFPTPEAAIDALLAAEGGGPHRRPGVPSRNGRAESADRAESTDDIVHIDHIERSTT